MAETVPLLELGSIRVPENSLSWSEARISAAAGTGPSIRNLTRAGDGFGAMSGTSNTKSRNVELAPAGVSAVALPDRHRRGTAGHMRFQIRVAHRRQVVHRPQRHAAGDDVDVEAVVGDRRAFPRQVANRRVDADLDALNRAALDPIDHPFANLRNDQGRPHPLQRGCRHRRSRETERQARFGRIIDAAGSGDADLAVADVGLGQQHARACRCRSAGRWRCD